MATPAIGSVTRWSPTQISPASTRQQAVDAAQQRGLAAARRADHGDDLALADLEVDVAEDFERAVVLAEALDADARLRPLRRRGSHVRMRRRLARHSAACDCRFRRLDLGPIVGGLLGPLSASSVSKPGAIEPSVPARI